MEPRNKKPKVELYFDRLSKDTVLSIFEFFDIKTILLLSTISKTFNAWTKDDRIWKAFFAVEFTTTIFDIGYCCSENIITMNISWIEKYKRALKERTNAKKPDSKFYLMNLTFF